MDEQMRKELIEKCFPNHQAAIGNFPKHAQQRLYEKLAEGYIPSAVGHGTISMVKDGVECHISRAGVETATL